MTVAARAQAERNRIGQRSQLVEGRFVVRGGEMVTIDLAVVVERQRALAARLRG